ncbi:phenylacetate--CoA ligase family protein [Ktedonosporobacter rubrisoli]|uniref:Phenylacetate--CoA ligase family protein n=1 Tax=Ktedonosporobacter rubrisoli TaxID=2509675 RepID=A0A4V0YZT7_KTERU|nr:phenylacetate--CoA ligase family protein [Ktedonosporobacter rubrisoli]QBD80861.1 phenylacetate--CoA ligase family protein [Ktedonosporobacter rubrisoli]
MDIKMTIDMLAKRRQIRAREHWTRERLETYQARSLRQLRDYAYAHSPFYQQFHKGLYEAPLEDLPALSKAMLMEHFDDLVTDRAIHLPDAQKFMTKQQANELYLGRYVVSGTSGSSGHPGVFLADRGEWLTLLAGALRAFEAAGIKFRLTHRLKLAMMTSTTAFHASTQGGASLGSWWMPVLNLAASEPVPVMVERLNAWQPEALLGYASLLRILADEQLAGRLHIKPHSMLSSSEVLTPETRRLVEQAWGKVLFNMYSSTECGLAAECNQHRGLHLQEDLVIVEVVDQNNRPVPPGVYGDKLLLTVLFKYTQPLIRYEMSDSVRLSAERCPCGRPFRLIDAIAGRSEEELSFAGAAGERVKIQPLVFNRIMDTLPVSGWQVVQQADDSLQLLLRGVHGELDDEELANTVRQALAEQGARMPAVAVKRVTSIPQSVAGKTPLIKSNR